MAMADTPRAHSLPPQTQPQQLNFQPQTMHLLAMESNGTSQSASTIKLSTSNTEPLENLQSKSFFNCKKSEVVEPQPQRSFSQVLQGLHRPISSMEPQPDLDMDSFLKPISILQGKPNVLFPLSEKKLLVDKLKLVLVGKFSHGMPRMNQLRYFFSKMKLQKSCTVSVLDRKHIFIECFCKNDYDFIWLQLTWVIEGFTMRVFKWSDQFNPTTESAIVPAWVRLEGIPLYMFDEKSLLAISNTVGRPIKVDPRNVSHTIVSSARICVELDVSKPLVDSICVSFEDDVTKVVVEGFRVKIFYDEVPPYCEFCYHIGHWIGSCKRREEKAMNMDHTTAQLPMKVCSDVQDAPVQLSSEKTGLGVLNTPHVHNLGPFNKNTDHPSPVRDCSAVQNITGVQVLGTTKSKQVAFGYKEKGVPSPDDQQCSGSLFGSQIGSNVAAQHIAADQLEHDSGEKGLKQVNAMLARQFLKAEIQNSVVLSGEPEIEMQHSSSGQIQQQLEVMKGVQTTTTDGNGRKKWDAKAGQPAAGKVNAGVDPAAAGQIEQVMKVLKTAAKAGTVRQRWEAEFGKPIDWKGNAGTDMEQVMKVVQTAAIAENVTAEHGQFGSAADGVIKDTKQVHDKKGHIQIGVEESLHSENSTQNLHQPHDIAADKSSLETLEGKLQSRKETVGYEVTAGFELDNTAEHKECIEEDSLDDMVADGMAGTAKDGNIVHTEGSHTQDAFSMFLDRMDRLRNKEPDEKGNVVTWPKIVSGSLKVIAPRSISPVGRSSEKMSKLRKRIDYLKYQEGQALVLETDYYNELDERLNEDLREQVAYYKEERQASSPKDSTEIVPREIKADASQVEEQDRSSAKRRGRNKNRNRKK